jgi:hypothetical protein
MAVQIKQSTDLPKCLKCGKKGVGLKAIICPSCVAELFGESDKPIIFCKKCKKSRVMDAQEKEKAEALAGIRLDTVPHKIILVSDSCPECYVSGDSMDSQFAALRQGAQA